MNDYNQRIIEEFRSNGGKVGGPWEGRPMVLLTTTGARSGNKHTTPLVPYADGDQLYVFGSMGGAPRHPAWYHNVLANPTVTVEHGTERFTARAEPLSGAERDDIYAKQAALLPAFAQYQERTSRVIPVIRLVREG
jgi:deazaflavin-dependent oxidoreductase (nitroreductase family)